MTAFYNEIDPYAAQWIRNLIAAGHIAPGVVDERDIRDLTPAELNGYSECHFFGGVAVWSHALRLAQFPSDLKIWSGSCPCQPFSAAGRGAGIADERHLWPHWFWLIEQCRPDVVLGEQVASKDGLGWLDLVSTDLENAGYAVGATDTCAAGVTMEWETSQSGEWLERAIRDCGDPGIAADLRDFADWAGAGNIGEGGKHIRQRLYFVGLADSQYHDRRADEPGRGSDRRVVDGRGSSDLRLADTLPTGRAERRAVPGIGSSAGLCAAGRLDDDDDARPQGHAGDDGATGREGPGGPVAATGVFDGLGNSAGAGSFPGSHGRIYCGEESLGARYGEPERSSTPNRLADADSHRAERGRGDDGEAAGLSKAQREPIDRADLPQRSGANTNGPGNYGSDGLPIGDDRPDAPDVGRDAVDWLFGRDAKWRAVRSGSFPLVNGATARVGRLRAFGNGLDAKTARNFCEVVREIVDGD